MTPFSAVLEFYMKEKDIRTYSIAKFCGVDRSNMYKMINGKRNPTSEEMVGRIAEYMRLKPAEKEHLLEAYQITVMGFDTYHRRKNVQDFLLSFAGNAADMQKKPAGKEYATVNVDEQELKRWQGVVARDRQLQYLMTGVLNIEMRKMEGKISLLMQPENRLVMELLVFAGARKENLCIEHIFCMSNTDDIIADKSNYNLNCLKQILPLFSQCICDYKPYCYYDNIVSHNNRFNFLSSMILTSEYAVVFSMEENYGMLLSDKDTIQHFQRLFQSLKEDAALMALKMDSLEKQLKTFQSMNFMDSGVGYQPESCLIPLIPAAFLDKYLNSRFKAVPLLRENVLQYMEESGKTMEESKSTFIFSETGIGRFAETGRISELPESVYYPLEYNDRMVLIRRLIRECEKGKYQMLKAEAPISETNICLYSGMRQGYLQTPAAQGGHLFLELRELGLLQAFRDYFESLDRKYFYSPQEAADRLRKMLSVRKTGHLSEN